MSDEFGNEQDGMTPEDQLIQSLDPVTRGKIIQQTERAVRAANAQRSALIKAGVEARIDGMIDLELENLTKRQGYVPTRHQVLDICDNIRRSVLGKTTWE